MIILLMKYATVAYCTLLVVVPGIRGARRDVLSVSKNKEDSEISKKSINALATFIPFTAPTGHPPPVSTANSGFSDNSKQSFLNPATQNTTEIGLTDAATELFAPNSDTQNVQEIFSLNSPTSQSVTTSSPFFCVPVLKLPTNTSTRRNTSASTKNFSSIPNQDSSALPFNPSCSGSSIAHLREHTACNESQDSVAQSKMSPKSSVLYHLRSAKESREWIDRRNKNPWSILPHLEFGRIAPGNPLPLGSPEAKILAIPSGVNTGSEDYYSFYGIYNRSSPTIVRHSDAVPTNVRTTIETTITSLRRLLSLPPKDKSKAVKYIMNAEETETIEYFISSLTSLDRNSNKTSLLIGLKFNEIFFLNPWQSLECQTLRYPCYDQLIRTHERCNVLIKKFPEEKQTVFTILRDILANARDYIGVISSVTACAFKRNEFVRRLLDRFAKNGSAQNLGNDPNEETKTQAIQFIKRYLDAADAFDVEYEVPNALDLNIPLHIVNRMLDYLEVCGNEWLKRMNGEMRTSMGGHTKTPLEFIVLWSAFVFDLMDLRADYHGVLSHKARGEKLMPGFQELFNKFQANCLKIDKTLSAENYKNKTHTLAVIKLLMTCEDSDSANGTTPIKDELHTLSIFRAYQQDLVENKLDSLQLARKYRASCGNDMKTLRRRMTDDPYPLELQSLKSGYDEMATIRHQAAHQLFTTYVSQTAKAIAETPSYLYYNLHMKLSNVTIDPPSTQSGISPPLIPLIILFNIVKHRNTLSDKSELPIFELSKLKENEGAIGSHVREVLETEFLWDRCVSIENLETFLLNHSNEALTEAYQELLGDANENETEIAKRLLNTLELENKFLLSPPELHLCSHWISGNDKIVFEYLCCYIGVSPGIKSM